MASSTVREALSFSALLRQPASVSREEKLAYVEEVLKLLEMEAYADAVVGVMGEGTHPPFIYIQIADLAPGSSTFRFPRHLVAFLLVPPSYLII